MESADLGVFALHGCEKFLKLDVSDIIRAHVKVCQTFVLFYCTGKFCEVALSKTIMLHCKLCQILVVLSDSDEVADRVT